MVPYVGFAFLMLLCRIGATTEDRVEHDYYKYHPMSNITSWMKQIVREYPSLVSIVAYGKTYENRTISLLKIGKSTGETKERKKAIWMDCGIHAREWIAPAFCQYFVREILQAYNKTDPKMSEMMKNVDFYVTPVLNVDGYIYSWKDNTTRLWRKSRSTGPEHCVCFGGTDLNRNFDAFWGTVGASRNCCSEVYCGAKASSEPETQAVTNFIGKMKDDVLCFLTIHSFGQWITIPYGHPNFTVPNQQELMEVGLAAADAIRNVHGMSYTVGRYDQNSGSSRDWARQVGIPYSFSFMLRDQKGQHGFKLPDEQIQPACQEAYAGVMHIIHHVHGKTTKTTARRPSVVLRANNTRMILNSAALPATTTLWMTLLAVLAISNLTATVL